GGLDRRNARRFVADLQYRRFFHRIDTHPLEHSTHAKVRRRTKPANAKLFALKLLDTFDFRTRDELIVQFIEQADEINEIRSFKIRGDPPAPRLAARDRDFPRREPVRWLSRPGCK